ncbi:hypothetical protein [Undibacterium sp. TS12]|uniref:hypothetical protein n=1 Tax=Undibacterium sp. TS12 TaxID=2908202 RepID=UPI001F4CAC61|nr:hypothetical protein [Undibacterium sp. TS12]MCH8621946.1 hypothetical protein [Undibacterium sp. TS12]
MLHHKSQGGADSSLSSMSLAEFHQQAGVHQFAPPPLRRMTLADRLPLNRRQPVRSQSALKLEDNDESDLSIAASSLIGRIQEEDQSVLRESLEREYDALERHTLFREVLERLNDAHSKGQDTAQAGSQVKKWLAELEQQHGESLSAARQQQDQFQRVLGSLLGPVSNGKELSLASVRANLNNTPMGGKEMALSPAGLAHALRQRFGDDFFMRGLAELRNHMASSFRHNPAYSPGPRLWLSMNDSKSFFTVQSCFSFAASLRQDISLNLGVAVKASQVDVTLGLLSVFDARKMKATEMASVLVEFQSLTNLQKMRLFGLMERTIAAFPMSFWQSDSYSQRLTILDEFRNAALAFALESTHSREVQLEELMRARLRRKKSQQDQRQGGQEHEEEHYKEEHHKEEEDASCVKP